MIKLDEILLEDLREQYVIVDIPIGEYNQGDNNLINLFGNLGLSKEDIRDISFELIRAYYRKGNIPIEDYKDLRELQDELESHLTKAMDPRRILDFVRSYLEFQDNFPFRNPLKYLEKAINLLIEKYRKKMDSLELKDVRKYINEKERAIGSYIKDYVKGLMELEGIRRYTLKYDLIYVWVEETLDSEKILRTGYLIRIQF